MTLYRFAFDHLATRTDPERAHHVGFGAIRGARLPLRALDGLDRQRRSHPPVRALGLTFPHPLGLAAGFDKNAVGIDALATLGFGHVEIGTVTGEPQPGNPRPRLFRLPADRAIVNRMGFNNDGAEVVARRLAQRRPTGPGAAQTATARCSASTSASPRWSRRPTLLATTTRARACSRRTPTTWSSTSARPTPPACATSRPSRSSSRCCAPSAPPPTRRPPTRDRPVPLLVKIAPDLSDDDVLAVADLALALGLDGVIATNTTIRRDGLRSDAALVEQAGAGGLSGPPVRERALEVLRLLAGRAGDRLTLVAVGGITTPEDARARLDAGATLLQAYTAFVYEGPLWPRRLVRGLERTPGGVPA